MNNPPVSNPPIFCAIDNPDLDEALKLCAAITEAGLGIKLGLEFFNALGGEGLKKIESAYPDIPIFLDLKYHDIPNTVGAAIRAVTHHIKPAYINIHASGGKEMMQYAREACPAETKLLAVTILTSLNEAALDIVGYKPNLEERAIQMAKLAQQVGLDGVVCSSHEIGALRLECGDSFTLMVPGIRPAGSSSDDQSRTMTPKEAMEKGATHLVIGRPITQAADPAQAAQEILESL